MKNKVQVLYGDGFHLRGWSPADAKWYIESRDNEIFKWTYERKDLTVKEAEAAIKRQNKNPKTMCFAVVQTKSDQLIGNIALVLDDDNKTAEIMYWLAPFGRGKGIATNAVRLLCSHAFNTAKIESIVLKTYRENMRSQQVAKRAGFKVMQSNNNKLRDHEYIWFELNRKNRR